MISKRLIKKTLEYFDKHRHNFDVVVKPSLPILYFGDLESYKKSELKIITVGKNPSNNEFRLKKNDNFSFVRFSEWDEDKKNLVESLNSYFDNKPLKFWFSCFEPILNGLSASFYKNHHSNIALHTDICSPIATNPTWSKLSKEIQNELSEEGLEIWKELIEELQPDILLVSIPTSIFKKVFGSKEEEFIVFDEKKNLKKRKKPYVVEMYKYVLDSQKKIIVLFGIAANRPFDTISDMQKERIGKKCLNTITKK